MNDPAPHNPSTLGTIRRNAGRMPAAQLARELGWSLTRLERVARENGYDLRQDDDPPALSVAEPPGHGRNYNPRTRCVSVNVLLYPADAAALDILARDNGIRRSRVVSRMVENARRDGVLPDLARRPSPPPVPVDDQPLEVAIR